MTELLERALDWAARGFRVFPLRPGTKLPAIFGWRNDATTDAATIQKVWARRDFNIGVLCTDMIVVDCDVKDGRAGLASYFDLGLPLETLSVSTPSGGIHYYLSGPSTRNRVMMADGVDVRSANGYVIAPGSVLPGIGVYSLLNDAPVLSAPESFLALVGAPRERARGELGIELDTETNVALAKAYLETAPLATKGAGGDACTFAVACGVRDFGISEDLTVELMLDHWNDRTDPGWSDDRLRVKVENAFSYALNSAGVSSPEAMFAGVEVAEPKLRVGAFVSGLVTRQFDTIEMRAIDWLWLGIVPKGYVTIFAGESGAGKSTVIADIVARVTTGAPWPGETETSRRPPGRVLWLGAEDSASELTGPRLKACGADLSKVTEIVGSCREGATATFSMQDDLESAKALLAEAVGQGAPFVMLVIDPITSYLPGQKLRKVDLNDAGQLRSILEPWLRLAEEFALALACVTHFGKDTSRTMMHRVLGSSAFAQTCRSLLAVIQQPPGIDGEADPHAKALLQVKTNLPEHPGGAWLFRTEKVEVGTDPRNGKPISATRALWDKLDVGLTPERATGGGSDRGRARRDAAFSMWMVDYFSKLAPSAWADVGEVRDAAANDDAATERWWRDNSARFLEKQNADGKWLCRPRGGPMACMDGKPIEVLAEFRGGGVS